MLIDALSDDLFYHPEIGTVVDRPDITRQTFNASTAELCRTTAGHSIDELRYCADSWCACGTCPLSAARTVRLPHYQAAPPKTAPHL
jgi:hypothetical protein